jgi:hypothetical protein
MAWNFPVVSSEFRSANAGRPRSRIFGAGWFYIYHIIIQRSGYGP